MNIPIYSSTIPTLSTDQMIEVDRAMIEDYRIELTQMMENAGRNLANLARTRFLDGNPLGRTIAVLAGSGGNGGGAMVCARHLQNNGGKVIVMLSKGFECINGVPKHQLEILQRMNLPILELANGSSLLAIENPDLIIDGIIGYSLKGPPQGTTADLIGWANSQDAPILALDIPSGLDATTGTIYSPAIIAEATMTLALPKAGLVKDAAKKNVGELYLADISVPISLYRKPPFNLDLEPIFSESDIVRIR